MKMSQLGISRHLAAIIAAAVGWLLLGGCASSARTGAADTGGQGNAGSGTVSGGASGASWSAVAAIDFSSKHNVLIQNADGTTTPMDVPYYTTRQIAPGTWQIQSDGDYFYLVEGDSEAVVIDTGYGAGNVREYCQTLTQKPVKNVINTHYHFDHTANDAYFDCVYMSAATKEKATIPYPSFAGIDFPRNYPTVIVGDGYVYHMDGRDLLVLEIPNHTEGGIALLDKKQRILFSGDEIMGMGININCSVEQFEKNMEKLEAHRAEFDTLCGGPAVMDASLVDKYLANAQYILSGKGTAVKALDQPKGNYQPPAVTANVPAGTTVYIRGRVRPEDGGPAQATEYTMVMNYSDCKLTYDVRKVTEASALLLQYNDKNAAEFASDGVKNLSAIAEVYGDGQKISAVAIEYKGEIDNSRLLKADYEAPGRTITAVYANTQPERRAGAQGVNGRYVIVEFDTSIAPDSGMPAGPQAQAPAAGAGTAAAGGASGGPGAGGPQLGQKSDKPAAAAVLSASLIQHFAIIGTDGTSYTGWSENKTSTKTVSLIVQDFKQYTYTDPAYPDEPLMYNLYVPASYNPAKKYPLVLFIHDAGAVSNNPTETLTQGLGAVVWASPAEQAKHECFVLAPQYNCVIADDSSTTSVQMDITVDLIKSLMTKYSIDAGRLYDTGQSMGGMTSIAMDIKYPRFFAASLLVACQWDAAKVAPMAGTPLWIVVSEGDSKALPGQTAIADALKKLGETVTKCASYWNAEGSASSLAAEVQKMRATKSGIYFTVFKGGSHRYTWQYAYSIEGLRDWLFEQKK